MYIQPTLIGNYSVIKSWGRLDSQLGNSITVFYDDFNEVILVIDRICKQRQYKGYHLHDKAE